MSVVHTPVPLKLSDCYASYKKSLLCPGIPPSPPLPAAAKPCFSFPSRFHPQSLSYNRILLTSPLLACDSSSAGEFRGQSFDEDEAQEAVADVLQESGASREDAVEIASKCPKYVQMLIENVQELDEHSLWSSWNVKLGPQVGEDEDGSRGGGGASFKEKVYRMAKAKGDDGVLPFLESVGVSRSASIRVAGYVSSKTLPDLIAKVKYIQDFALVGSGRELVIGKNARHMMMQLSIPIDEDIQQTLSFFEKMEARRGGLKMLGFADSCLSFLIESFPHLLLLSVENHLKPLFEFILTLGVPKGNIKDIVVLFPPILFYDVKNDLKPKINALQKMCGENDAFAKILLKYPWILSTSIQVNHKEILSFFVMKKVPKSYVEHAIKSWPHLLGCSTNKMEAMVKKLDTLGVRNKMLGTAIASSPQLLLRKPNMFLEVISFLKEVGLEDEMIPRILCRCPEIFASNVDETLKRKIGLLTNFGISRRHLPRVIKKYPELLVSDVHDTLLPRMKYLMEIGLSRRDVASMIHRFSPLLGYSIEVVLKPKLEYLLKIMEKPLKEVVEYPRYFSYSLEKKIKPRYCVLKGRNIQCSLKDMLGKNDEEFAVEFMGIGRMLVLPSPPTSGSQTLERKSF